MSAKQNILAKLRNSLTGTTPVPDNFDVELVTEPYTYTQEQRIPQLRKLMEAVHTEIHLTSGEGWPELLAQLQSSNEPLPRRLDPAAAQTAPIHAVTYNEAAFRYALNEDAMGTEKLSEGIRVFAADAAKLDAMIESQR